MNLRPILASLACALSLHAEPAVQTAADLAADLIHSEPTVTQPAFLNFDERGRMWVVHYNTYPNPAGLKLVSRDRFWRNIYDRVPAAPGQKGYVRGADKITIHEDSNGDGTFDSIKTFVDGLNLATSCVRGNGGVYVLQPPYLLHYPDSNNDDIPDSNPEILLEGFGIEDSHAVVNSLTWGPDGWLYAAQGSTVTSQITIPGSEAPPVERTGQLMWRYHPIQKRYEIFAEGGGNIWSCEFDSKGRLFAGHNGGSAGFHYDQGAYFQKNFNKHGQLSNRFAYGHFKPIFYPGWQRLSTNIVIYEGGALPTRYDGSPLWMNSLQNKAGAAKLLPQGQSFSAETIDTLVSATDKNFRPVYTDYGPSGDLYIADWRDSQINHYRNHEGQINKTDGAIWRIRQTNRAFVKSPDFSQYPTSKLVEQLSSPNRWIRETARRLIAEHPDNNLVIPTLRQGLRSDDAQLQLESLWILHCCDQLNQSDTLHALSSPHEHTRSWAIRLWGDAVEQDSSPALVAGIIHLSQTDKSSAVLCQIASSAQRLQPKLAIQLIRNLSLRSEMTSDTRLPLLTWWALEKLATKSPQSSIRAITQKSHHSLTSRLVRRLSTTGIQTEYQACQQVFDILSPEGKKVAVSAILADPAIDITSLPKPLIQIILNNGGDSLSLRTVLGDTQAQIKASALLSNLKTADSELISLCQAFGKTPYQSAEKPLLSLLSHKNEEVSNEAINALFNYKESSTSNDLIEKLPSLSPSLRTAAIDLAISRKSSQPKLISKIKSGEISSSDLTPLHLEILGLNNSAPTQTQAEINRVKTIVSSKPGDLKRGLAIYTQRCASCHVLHSQGGHIGPDLTYYQRTNIDDLLLAIVKPSAEIREGFEAFTVKTKAGQTFSGFLFDQSNDEIVIRKIGGGDTRLARRDISSLKSGGTSLMPAGLLTGLTEQQLRDLFSYLATPQPLNLKR